MSSTHQLIPDLGSSDDQIRENARGKLISAGSEVVPALINLLRDVKNRQPIALRTEVADILGEIGDIKSIEPLLDTYRKNFNTLSDLLSEDKLRERQNFRESLASIESVDGEYAGPKYLDPAISHGEFGAAMLDALSRLNALINLPDLGEKCTSCDREFVIPAGRIVFGRAEVVVAHFEGLPMRCDSCGLLVCRKCSFLAGKSEGGLKNICPACHTEVSDCWE